MHHREVPPAAFSDHSWPSTPTHTDHARLMHYTPRRLQENEYYVAVRDMLIDGFLGDGSCELVSQYAEPFTLTVVADLEGVPEADHSLFRTELSTDHQAISHKPLEFLYDRFSEYIEKRRRQPGNDILTGLATATFPDGSTPECERRRLIAANLFAAGGDDRAAAVLCTRMLAERPDLQKLLRDDRERSPTSSKRHYESRARYERSSG